MLVGINGYSGSGKDTVGTIIQYLNSKKKANVTLEEACKDYKTHKHWLEEESGWEIKKFAGKLKEIATLLTGIPQEMFEDQDFKKTPLNVEWWTPCDEGYVPMLVRDFLQKLGTDGLRNGLHTNVWVNALMVDYKTDKQNGSKWVITDVRFPNEAHVIKQKGGIIIRVDRPGVKPVNFHPSEISLDGWNFDYKIANISDLMSLQFTVQTILEKAKLL